MCCELRCRGQNLCFEPEGFPSSLNPFIVSLCLFFFQLIATQHTLPTIFRQDYPRVHQKDMTKGLANVLSHTNGWTRLLIYRWYFFKLILLWFAIFEDHVSFPPFIALSLLFSSFLWVDEQPVISTGTAFPSMTMKISSQGRSTSSQVPLLRPSVDVRCSTVTLLTCVRMQWWLYFSSEYLMCTQYSVITTAGI